MADKNETPVPLVVRVAQWVDALPEWLKPVAFGPLILLGMMAMRGALVIGPILVVILLIRSDRPVHDLGIGASMFVLLVVASATGGLVYGLVGRSIKRVPFVGPYVAGILSVAPYMITLIPIIRLSESRPLFGPFDGAELFASAICAILFGGVLGHMMFRPGAMD